MKKSLLFASAAVFALTSFAQSSQSDKSIGIRRTADGTQIDQEQPQSVVIKQTGPTEKAASVVNVGTSYNVYTILGDRQNQVVYNPALNTVAFSHRQNDGLTGGSGIISWDYSTDGGANWTVNPFAATPLGATAPRNGNRYPNMSIYNPSGNTATANAFMVEVGPNLANGTTSGANGWAATFQASAKFDGSMATETYDVNSTAVNGDDNEWGSAGLYTGTNGVVWYATTNTGTGANTVADNYSEFNIIRGDFNSTNNNFDWTVSHTVTQAWNITLNGTDNYGMAGLMNMAWSSDGMTGYMVTMASWGANTMWRPYVMKTTNGGTSWANVNDYDFSQNSVFQCYIYPSDFGDATSIRPWFQSYDMVVDAAGELRIFAEVNSQASAHQDSLLYSYSSRQSGYLFEIATNGTGWDVTFIDSVLVDDYEWDPTNTMTHYIRPQASRSQDGTKLFYTWLSSDASLGFTDRSVPDIYSTGHNVTTGLWTPITNLTTGTPAEFTAAYQTVAVETIENGTEKNYEIATIYGDKPGGGGLGDGDGLTAVQWIFLRGIGFDNTDFTLTELAADPCLPTSVSTPNRVEAELVVYPNPATEAFTIFARNAENFSYTVIDIVGNVVASKSITGNKTVVDMSNNAKGVYFVQVENGNTITSTKIMLTK